MKTMNPLQTRLAALRRRLRLVVTFRGGCWALAVLFVGVAGAGLIDYGLYQNWNIDLPRFLRAFFLAATLGGAGCMLWLFLWRPLRRSSDDLSLALRVEEAYPVLNDALASTVQFLQQPKADESTTSSALRGEAVQRAMRLAQSCDFTKIVDTRGLRLASVSLLVTAGLAVLLVWLNQASAMTALWRLADPFGDHRWQGGGRRVQIDLVFPPQIGYGQRFVLRGTIRGDDLPRSATIVFKGLVPSPQEYRLKIDPESKSATLHAVLDMTLQRTDFRFQVWVGSAVSPGDDTWHLVKVRPPPQLVALNGKPSPQIELHYPRYTELRSPSFLKPGSGSIEEVAGTRVILRGATDRPIAKAWIDYQPQLPFVTESALLSPIFGGDVAATLGRASGGHAVWGRAHGQIASHGQEFVLDFQPWIHGTYLLNIQDVDGLAKEYVFDLRIFPDPAPAVSLQQPATSQSVLANAGIALQVAAEDELSAQGVAGALKCVYLEYRRRDRDGDRVEEAPRRLVLYDHQTVNVAVPQILSAFAAAPVPMPAPVLKLRPDRLTLNQRWSLDGLVKEGDVLVLQACAEDFNDIVAFPQPGRSHEIELRVVSRGALVVILDEAQAQLEQELLRLRELQQKAIKQVIGAEEQWRATGKLRPEDSVELAQAEELQKQIQARIGAQPDEGLRAELARMQQLLRDNNLPRSTTHERLKQIKEELDRLARAHLPQIEPRLANARRELENLPKAEPPDPADKGPIGEARDHQEEVKKTLDDLLRSLENWSGTQEIKGELRSLLKEQHELQRRTEELRPEIEKFYEDMKDVIKAPPGKKLALRPTHEGAVRELAELHQQLAKRAQSLLEKMKRLGEELEKRGDLAGAEMLKKAVDIGRKGTREEWEFKENEDKLHDIPGELADTREQLLRKEMKRAADQQGETIKAMERMVEAMEEQRGAELARLVKDRRQEQKHLDELRDGLERLRKKVDEARKIADPKEREAALKKLGEEQRKLKDETDKKARELARLQAPGASKALDQAADRMDDAAKKLGAGQDPDNDQEDALDKVKEAQGKLQDAQNIAEEELAREQHAKLLDRLKGLKARQDSAVAESARLHKEMLQKQKWTHGLITSLGDLADTQQQLGKETASLKDKLKNSLVFELILDKTIQAMDGAANQLKERKAKTPLRKGPQELAKEELADEDQSDREIQKRQNDASRRLQRLIDAMKDGPDVAKQPNKDADPKGGNPKDSPQRGADGDGISSLAQLRALRAEQNDVNERTKDFAERHPNVEKLPEMPRLELEAIQRDQERVFELFQKMAAAANAPGGNP
jgi:hypothetical protein